MTRLDDAYVAQIKGIRERVNTFARAEFARGGYRDADLDRFVNAVLPQILGARKTVAALTDAYLSERLTQVLGRRVQPQGVIDTDGLRGVAAEDVYQRPYKTVWTKLAEGSGLDAAVSAATARLTDIVLTDMQMAKVRQSQAVVSGTSGVTAFKRTLTGRVNCGMCYVASTQRYHKGDLLPIHPGCDCGVDPIADNGEQVIDQDTLSATHEAIHERFGISDSGARAPDYRKVLLVREHGEIGPVLTVKSHSFTGPDDL